MKFLKVFTRHLVDYGKERFVYEHYKGIAHELKRQLPQLADEQAARIAKSVLYRLIEQVF